MESGAWRRLNCISRHFLTQNEANEILHLNCSSAPNIFRHVDSEPIVLGGMVMDIHATSSIPARPRTTTPGKVQYVKGGVARNIAECMSKLGTKPFMISVIGYDMAGVLLSILRTCFVTLKRGNLLLEYWESSGLATEGIQRRKDIGTPVVCNFFDAKGEVAAGVASVEAIELFLTQEWIQKFSRNISSAPILVVDANLNPQSLEASCQMAADSGVPVWFEPVSIAKSKKVASVVKYVTVASPNEDELIAMANALSYGDRFRPIQREVNGGSKRSIQCLFQMLKPAILVLLEKGVKIVVLTLGSEGVFLCSKDGYNSVQNHLENIRTSSFGIELYATVNSRLPSDEIVSAVNRLHVLHFPSLVTSVVRLTGAGDCLVGGILASLCSGLNLRQSIAVGIAAAKASVEVESNVPTEYCLTKIAGFCFADDARLVYSSAKVVCDEPLV
ncbi:hypothetical protein GIB67_005478 [Kingdonia uniflora]|uniref:Carbohydrate kinase PfkB domain-containing protein n=1 Tax=Kingdonia uniflora TaxID=39325 RepID=A0A7J7NHF0_9MAGN|nr:hypothetical protein GIB67_005478 [Kingdonia uniflora]